MGAGRQWSMPSLPQIAAYWETGDNAAVFTRLTWVELAQHPLCFRCGWFCPTPDMDDAANQNRNPWTYTNGWLERAHLIDRCLGGPNRPDNLVPLCSICHRLMPELIETRDAGIDWINAWDPASRNPLWQGVTDSLWSGDRYRRFPGTSVLLNVRLLADDDYRRQMHIAAERRLATSAT